MFIIFFFVESHGPVLKGHELDQSSVDELTTIINLEIICGYANLNYNQGYIFNAIGVFLGCIYFKNFS